MFLRRAASGPWALSFVVAGTWACCFSVIAWIATSWFWYEVSPVSVVPVAGQVSDALSASRAIAARHLMGEVQAGTVALAPDTKSSKYKLLGAMTSSEGRTGFAVLAEEGKRPISVLEGEDVAPGLRLVKVGADHVVLRQGAVFSEIPLAFGSPASSSAAAGSSQRHPDR